jgi:hypothetical protein
MRRFSMWSEPCATSGLMWSMVAVRLSAGRWRRGIVISKPQWGQLPV